MKILFAVLVAAVAASGARAVEVSAAFGLRWGMTISEVEALGVKLDKQESPAFGVAATATNLPITISDGRQISLFFGYDDHLWRIFLTSSEWDNDKYGTRAQARFQELATLLREKYGKESSYNHEPDNQYTREADEFASSLSSKDRIVASVWETDAMTIELSLGAHLYDTYYTLAYENKALGSAARTAIKARDKGAL
jgi:hypothetical protein